MKQELVEVNKQKQVFPEVKEREVVLTHYPIVELQDNQPIEFNLSVKVDVSIPFIHPDEFAKLIGLSSGVVGGWIDNGYIPTVKTGKYRMVNLVKLTAELQGA